MVFGTSIDVLPEGGRHEWVAEGRIRSYCIPQQGILPTDLRWSDITQDWEPGERGCHQLVTNRPHVPS